MSEPGWLVWRRAGGLWAVEADRVRRLTTGRGGIEVHLACSTLLADSIVGVAKGMVVRAGGGVLARFYPESCAGLAVLAGAPVVIVREEAPPALLCADRKGVANAE